MRSKQLFGVLVVFILGCSADTRSRGKDRPGLLGASRFPREELIRQIVSSGLSTQAKLTLLKPFVRVGQSIEEVNENLGVASYVIGHGPGFVDISYQVGLRVSFYPDGEAYAIGYFDSRGQYVCLVFAEPVTWPKRKKAK